MNKPEFVISTLGGKYRLGPELGRGGEGTVFAVVGGRHAVKLFSDRSLRMRDRLRDRLAMVGRLPLDGLGVARHIDQLRPPYVGYVMELFTGMEPIRSLLCPPRGTANVAEWYLHGGGLRRRLRILASVAEILSELHGRGLVFADLSPSNILVSKSSDQDEVRLIDTDNLHPATAPGRPIYTPRYGAPEVVRAVGVPSTLGDAWALAVVGFETLTLVHPLLGDMVQNGEPEMEERALEGRLPWIDAEDDDRNRSSDGIPREIVLSKRLSEAFGRAFGVGRSKPDARPGVAEWAARLHAAADRTVTCPECSSSYFCNEDRCPWCDACCPAFVMAQIGYWDPHQLSVSRDGRSERCRGIIKKPSGSPRLVHAFAISANTPVDLTERVTHGTSGRTPTLRVTFAEQRIRVEPLDAGDWFMTVPGRRAKIRITLPYEQEFAIGEASLAGSLDAGPDDRPHRVIYFRLMNGSHR